MYFLDDNIYADYSIYRYRGRSVRLVRSAQNCFFGINVTPNSAEGGTVSGAGTYQYGSSCTLTAVPNTGYFFVNWTKDGEEVSDLEEYTFIVTDAANYVANFMLKSYSVTANANPTVGGTVTGGGYYEHGTTCTLTATPNEGYSFIGWTKNGNTVSSSPNYSFVVTAGGTYIAQFSLNSYTITVLANPTAGGTVTGAGTYQPGSSCTLTAVPRTGYLFVNWTKDGEEVSDMEEYTFTVTESAEYVANFMLKSYSITAKANPTAGGTVTGGGNYEHGTTCALTAMPNPGYYFIRWTKNGSTVSTDPSYSFQVNAGGTYIAQFGVIFYEVSAWADPDEGGTVTGADSYRYGVTCTLTATANEGYAFVNWTEQGLVVSTDAVYSFTVTDNAELVAHFELVTMTQTSTLVQGWNWWAPTVETTLQDLKTALGTNGLTIKAEDGSALSYANGQWSGTLTSLALGQMYRVKTSAPCEFTLNGTKPASVMVSLASGTNWFGYTGDTSAAIADVFDSAFNPTLGDKVVSQTEGFAIFNGTTWEGTLDTLNPGQGYVYVSQAQATKTVTF